MMNVNLMVLTLTVILIGSISASPAFGQVSAPITVTVDKESYSEGETIMVMGDVSQRLSGFPVSITVTAPNGNLVTIKQINVETDMKFSVELVAGGPLMKSEGTYTIQALYGGTTRVAETTFEFSGVAMISEPETEPEAYLVMIDESSYSLPYTIMGATLVSIEPNLDEKSLVITIDSMDDGWLSITLPRSVIDAMDGDMDSDFIVLVDNEESNDVEETKMGSDRMLTIPFSAGAEKIEIIGTWIIPEFGTIAVMILVVAIISIIAITSRSRLSIMPRY